MKLGPDDLSSGSFGDLYRGINMYH